MQRVILAVVLGASFGWAGLGHAVAAKPAVHACFGSTISAEARANGSDFGQLVASEAHEFGGVGELVQLFQAGEVPDEVEQNDCN